MFQLVISMSTCILSKAPHRYIMVLLTECMETLIRSNFFAMCLMSDDKILRTDAKGYRITLPTNLVVNMCLTLVVLSNQLWLFHSHYIPNLSVS